MKRFIITNAAGCVNTDWNAGELMLISDHINLSGNNPLIGKNHDKFGPRFPDMTYTYNRELREKLKKEASAKGIQLREGVYAMFTGPSFETPAEIRFARIIGADAVGMSTVPEAIIANHAGLEIIGISFLSNMAAGVLDKPLTGEEVTEAAHAYKRHFRRGRGPGDRYIKALKHVKGDNNPKWKLNLQESRRMNSCTNMLKEKTTSLTAMLLKL